jgi:HEAT repeat protein
MNSSDSTAASETHGQGPLDAAFEALQNYQPGSGRASLMPIDEAVSARLDSPAPRAALEARLVAAWATCSSDEAREYLCSKLALIGTASSVPILATLLGSLRLSQPARNALEAIPEWQAGRALRRGMSNLSGPQQVGAINSLGIRRDLDSVGPLARLLKSPDLSVASAAAAALGSIGTSKAAHALRIFHSRVPEGLKQAAADAMLICAERLLADGHEKDAQALYALLDTPSQPQHIRAAAARASRK